MRGITGPYRRIDRRLRVLSSPCYLTRLGPKSVHVTAETKPQFPDEATDSAWKGSDFIGTGLTPELSHRGVLTPWVVPLIAYTPADSFSRESSMAARRGAAFEKGSTVAVRL